MKYNEIMLLKTSLLFLFFLPVVESFSRGLALGLLFLGALIISYPVFRMRKISFDGAGILFLIFIITGIISTVFSLSYYRSLTELGRYIVPIFLFL